MTKRCGGWWLKADVELGGYGKGEVVRRCECESDGEREGVSYKRKA
jgi:hypothetical protein